MIAWKVVPIHSGSDYVKLTESDELDESEIFPLLNTPRALREDEFHVCGSDSSDVPGSIRKWDKKHYCFYGCEMPQSKLPRHLVMLEKDPVKRKKLLCKLRNVGKHKHNCEVLREQRGNLIVAYIPAERNESRRIRSKSVLLKMLRP